MFDRVDQAVDTEAVPDANYPNYRSPMDRGKLFEKIKFHCRSFHSLYQIFFTKRFPKIASFIQRCEENQRCQR